MTVMNHIEDKSVNCLQNPNVPIFKQSITITSMGFVKRILLVCGKRSSRLFKLLLLNDQVIINDQRSDVVSIYILILYYVTINIIAHDC